MWQKSVVPYVASGDLIAIGVVQEQHPDRTRLYRQWRELDWPIFVDSLNLLEHVTVVPIPMAIDENGVVVHPQFNPRQLDAFMAKETKDLGLPPDFNRAAKPSIETLQSQAETEDTSAAWQRLGEALFAYSDPSMLDESVAALERSVRRDEGNGRAQFALGAALRRRYESPLRDPRDAQRAVIHWGLALEENPNHYIRRRRLQQYGPRLDKPYNFYFWVAQARKAILERGQVPIQLSAEPMGSELAPPQRKGADTKIAKRKNPDPKGRIARDKNGLVGVETLVTPSRVRPGHRFRARVNLRLNEDTHPLWNNEAGDLRLWVDLPKGLTLIEDQLTHPNPTKPETREMRQLEFEAEIPADHPPGQIQLPAYALYYVCADEGGVCYYLRKDFQIAINIDPTAPLLK